MIEEKLCIIAERNGLKTTERLNLISAVKEWMLCDKWVYCPCDLDNNKRYCGSKLCMEDIKTEGICHCGLFERK